MRWDPSPTARPRQSSAAHRWLSGRAARPSRAREAYIGYVEELPGANTQGATLEEARDNLREAIELERLSIERRMPFWAEAALG
jgi:hypothetical protein